MSNIQEGIGLMVEKYAIDCEDFLAFWAQHIPDEYRKEYESCNGNIVRLENILDNRWVSNTDECGPWGLFAEVIRKETNIRVFYYTDEYENAWIGMERKFPWEYNKEEKAIDIERFRNIIGKYLQELDSNIVINDMPTTFIFYIGV